ncbi:MAG: response regulator [Caldilineaceae bacterium]
MLTYADFEKAIKEALAHLTDPEYLPPAMLCQRVGCLPHEGKAGLRAAIQQGIESLKPPADTPPGAYNRLMYELLDKRFLLKLTQEETAYQLNVSRRTINRLQQSALEALATLLWTHGQQEDKARPLLPQPERLLQAQAPDWNAQLQHELNCLETKAPHALADVGDVLKNVLGIMNAMTPKLAAEVKVMASQPSLIVTSHPVILHQILLSLLRRLSLYLVDGRVEIYARFEDGNAKISLTGAATAPGMNLTELTRDLPTSKDITITSAAEGGRIFVWLTVAAVGKVTVLAVDDNEDMARFYQDCAIGTRYHIIPVANGNCLFDAIHTNAPHIIVLDIMLPDIDGWRLLMRLHEDPTTSHIPVIVCTVIREEDLALALGAAGYLAKPVRPGRFIQALDQVYPLVVAEAPLAAMTHEAVE